MDTMDFIIWAVSLLLGSLPCSLSSDMSTIIVYLSSKNLSSVPDWLSSYTEALDLSHNHIQALGKEDFHQTSSLCFLNVSYNVIQSIDPKVFHSTPHLEFLDLSHNKLHSLLGQSYLWMTPNLTYLDLSFNEFVNMTLGDEFSNLGKLEDLRLSAEVIQDKDFMSISSLHLNSFTLYVSVQTRYKGGSLTNVVSKKIIISTKSDCDFTILGDALTFFSEVKLDGFKGQTLAAGVSQRSIIKVTHLELVNTLTAWKHLTSFVDIILSSSVKHLSFDMLTCDDMKPGRTVGRSSNLESFYIRQASVTVFLFSQEMLYDFIINMPVRNLTVVQTPIIHVTCPQSPSRIHTLDLSDCALSERVFSRGGGSGVVIECNTLQSVEILSLKGNNLQDLKQLSNRVQLMSSLRSLDLSQNKLLYHGEPGDCVWPSNILHLNLSSNSFDNSVFHCLPKTIISLELQDNDITVMKTDILKLESLQILDLTNNRFHDVPDCTAFPNLQRLLLRGNSLQSPSLDFVRTCPALQDLDASNNSFICTCSLQEFTSIAGETVAAQMKLLHWPGDYSCSYPDTWRGTLLKNFSLPAISCSAGLLATAILVPAAALVIAVAMLCHQLDGPWYMGMICQWARAKKRGILNRDRPEDLQGIVFHAFVSYSQRNAEWVKGQLIPKLEEEDTEGIRHGLRVCHHERDFIPGKPITENILLCVEKSRRCIFVLSSDFVRSEWCHYELCFANHQRVTRRFDSVILVLLEPLPLYLIPSKYYQLKDMMSRRTYLEWPRERAKQVLFWANLRAALQADLPPWRRNYGSCGR
ncbi:toll-like receptor 1 [Alosa sapidissima]|uniref:toll-like receptor 1 n=1 Tax=Alosa sapidissima TaxID=34773 RepID=UPI001C09E10A|nr:toll-like receptor 1 [Alosa sapidissima]XP_041918331.1 toll-like receptor 1 [Alosa sapidissima]